MTEPGGDTIGASNIGRNIHPIDWREKTTGSAKYAGDRLPGTTLHAKVLRSPYPHAKIKKIDISRASRVPGVRAVITSRDFGEAIYDHSAEGFSDRPPLAREKVLYVGQEVAAIAADTVEIAERALSLIKVQYRKLPTVLNMHSALKWRAPKLHERTSGTNVALGIDGVWGDKQEGLTNSTLSVSGTYRYQRVAHQCMEPNTAVAWWHDERLEVWASSQAPHFVVHELSRVLGLRQDQVVCRDVSVGGGFGSKSKVSEHEALAGMLSIRTGKPVSLAYTRQEETSATKPRHEFVTTIEGHVDSYGRICYLDASVDVDNGAYNHYGPSVMRAGIKQLGSMYRPDAVAWRGRLIDTNLVPGGQFRGYGTPQTALALESIVDQLAEASGTDPIQFRIENASEPNSTALAGAKIGSNRLRECLQRAREMIDWDTKKEDNTYGHGVGVAAGMHASGSYAYPGGNVSAAGVEIDRDGHITVRFGGADAGTGQRTILAQIAAEVLGDSAENVSVIMADWDETPPEMGAWSSRGTHMGGHATRQAAEAVRDRIRAAASQKLGTEQVQLKNGTIESANGVLDLGDVIGLCEGATEDGLRIDLEFLEERMEPYWTGIPTPNISPSYTYAAHAVQVEVDTDTGELSIVDYVAAHDVGHAINPGMVRGQISGGVVQGLGPVLGEELVYEDGRVANDGYVNYPVPRFTSVPPIRTVLVDGDEPAGPFGAKSVGEMPIVPPAPAVLNAVYDAIGIRFHELPLTPDVILNALRDKDGRSQRSFHLARRPGRWQIEIFRRLYPWGIHYALETFGRYFVRKKKPRRIEHVSRPQSSRETAKALASSSASKVCGGGTDLIVQQQQGLANPKEIVLTRTNPELNSITRTNDGIRIGAGVSLRELTDWSQDAFSGLAEAIKKIASIQIRETATVGGNLAQEKRCWFYRSGFDCYKRAGVTRPCYAVTGDNRFYHAAIGGHRCQAVTPSDLASIFMAMEATVEVVSTRGQSVVSIDELYTGPGELSLKSDEFIQAVCLPHRSLKRSLRVEKLQLTEGDFALVSLAASASVGPEGRWREPRLVFGSLAPVPWRALETEKALDASQKPAQILTDELSKELSWNAHPLDGNAWKIEAAIGLSRRIARVWGDNDG